MSDDRENVRSRVSLVDIIGRDVRLKRSGKNWMGLCPFHDDKNPSFVVSDEKGYYRCWSCGAKGDVFSYVMETQKLGFRDALEYLAQIAGIQLKKTGGEAAGKRKSLSGMMNVAQDHFVANLSKNKVAIEYCRARGLNEQVIAAWGLGFADPLDEAIPTMLKRAGYALAEAAEVFLTDGDEARGYVGKFRGRLMFPIHDHRGQLVAFGGRLLGDGTPKYINSSDTPLYSKRRVLYGFHRAKDAIAKSETAVLVEGYLDVIACHRAGLTNAVASLGTALSEDHVKLLKTWCREVVIVYDGDSAGQKATDRAIDMFGVEGFRVKVCVLKKGQDPDTLLRDFGPEAVISLVENGVTPTEFRLARVMSELDPGDESYWRAITEILASTNDEMELVGHVERIAPTYPGIRDPQAARSAMLKQVRARRSEISNQTEAPTKAVVQMQPHERLVGPEAVLIHALEDEKLRALAWPHVARTELFHSDFAVAISRFFTASYGDRCPSGPLREWLPADDSNEIAARLLDELLVPLSAPVDQDSIIEAVGRLEQRLERHSLRLTFHEATQTDEGLVELQTRLRKLKGVVEP
ncbi:MAG: DNA primase [Chthonomonas sp.]|nr:DNA primase [Chthonomonas sp.]